MAETTRPGNPDPQAIALLQSSGILNPNVTLEKIMEASAALAGELRRDGAWYRHFHTRQLCLQSRRLGGYGGIV